MAKYLTIDTSGNQTEANPVVTSAGAADAGELVALDAGGKLDQSVLPAGVGPDVVTAVASEALAAGDFVNIFDNAGTPNVRKADNTVANQGRVAHGFVLQSVAAGATATIYREGYNNALSGLTAGSRYFLSAAGAVTATPTTTPGETLQSVGYAVDATTLSVIFTAPVTRA